MTDYFALLGEPRRPHLDPERIKETFHRLSRERHPDQAGGEAGSFTDLNLAQETLRDPKARLRHLLALEHPEIRTSGPTVVPASLAEEFAPTHELLQVLAAFAQKRANATGALARALLAGEGNALHDRAKTRFERLQTLEAAAHEELRAFDARDRHDAAALVDFYGRFAYLSRWIEQLRERLFHLEFGA